MDNNTSGQFSKFCTELVVFRGTYLQLRFHCTKYLFLRKSTFLVLRPEIIGKFINVHLRTRHHSGHQTGFGNVLQRCVTPVLLRLLCTGQSLHERGLTQGTLLIFIRLVFRNLQCSMDISKIYPDSKMFSVYPMLGLYQRNECSGVGFEPVTLRGSGFLGHCCPSMASARQSLSPIIDFFLLTLVGSDVKYLCLSACISIITYKCTHEVPYD